MTKLTPAGLKMLKKYLELESHGLPAYVDDWRKGHCISKVLLPRGNGSAKKTAEKLENDGYVHLKWSFNGMYTVRSIVITAEGRKIMQKQGE